MVSSSLYPLFGSTIAYKNGFSFASRDTPSTLTKGAFMYWIEYNLHKDGSWVADGFATKDDAEKHIIDLKRNGYTPRRKYPKGV